MVAQTSVLSEQMKAQLREAKFTEREISLYRQKFYNLLATQPVPLTEKPLEDCPRCGLRRRKQ